MPAVDVLLPTYNRLSSLVMTLTGLAMQTLTDYRVIISDQSDTPVIHDRVVQNLLLVIETRGGVVDYIQRPQVHGIAEQRDFLLNRARAETVLYLDDDVCMQHWVLQTLLDTLQREDCAFVGAFPMQPRYRYDVRPHQEAIEFWDGKVTPEAIDPGAAQWARAELHHAANLYHAAQRLVPGERRLYKVAWVASCILYRRDLLLEVGGFSFWNRLPRFHSGEEVLVQNLLLRRWGGCAIIPSGTYFSEMESTVLNEAGTVDGHAIDLLPELIARTAPERGNGHHASTKRQPNHRQRTA